MHKKARLSGFHTHKSDCRLSLGLLSYCCSKIDISRVKGGVTLNGWTGFLPALVCAEVWAMEDGEERGRPGGPGDLRGYNPAIINVWGCSELPHARKFALLAGKYLAVAPAAVFRWSGRQGGATQRQAISLRVSSFVFALCMLRLRRHFFVCS